MGPIGGWNIWGKSGERTRQFTVALASEHEAIAMLKAENPDIAVVSVACRGFERARQNRNGGLRYHRMGSAGLQAKASGDRRHRIKAGHENVICKDCE